MNFGDIYWYYRCRFPVTNLLFRGGSAGGVCCRRYRVRLTNPTMMDLQRDDVDSNDVLDLPHVSNYLRGHSMICAVRSFVVNCGHMVLCCIERVSDIFCQDRDA